MLDTKLFIILFNFSSIRNFIRYLRCFWFIKIKKNKIQYASKSKYVSENTIFSNKRHVLLDQSSFSKKNPHPSNKYLFGIKALSNGGKISLMLNPLLSIDKIRNNKKNLKILCIGPRDEAEIFNIISKGFKLKNITSIDLFSYSPLITVGDMHSLNYDDNYFDIVISGWCLAYSDNKSLAAKEIMRVTKKSGFIAISASYKQMKKLFKIEDILLAQKTELKLQRT